MPRLGDEDAFAEGTTTRRLLRIAVPLTLSGSVRYGVELSNAYWVGKLGVVALSTVTALGTFMFLSKMFAGLTSAGTSAVVGRLVGEDRAREAYRTAQKVVAVALVLGAAVAALGIVVSPYALVVLGFRGAQAEGAAIYLTVLLVGLPASFGMLAMNGVLVGLGKARASMIASTVALGVGCAVTPLLVHVLRVGVWGAAASEVLGDACGYLVGMRALHAAAGPLRVLPWRKRFRKLDELWPVVRVGAPLTVDAVLHGTAWFVLIAFLSRYGHEYVAAQGAEERLAQILNLPTEGVAPAAATLVGYYLGKRQHDEARRVVWIALGLVCGVASIGAVLFRIMPATMAAWFCDDARFVDVGAKVLPIAAFGVVFMGGRDVLEGAFGGIGNTLPAVVTGVVVAASRIPLAYLVAVRLGQGGLGVAWAVNLTLAAQTLFLFAWLFLRFGHVRPVPIKPGALSIVPPAVGAAPRQTSGS